MKKLLSILIALVVVLVIIIIGIYLIDPRLQYPMEKSTVPLRILFVVIGILIALAVYLFTRENDAWKIGTRQVVWMAIGAALYAVFSWLFNGTVFLVPSVSQVSLRPAVAIPMFFGFAFGPWVGFFTGAVGNMFGDALTGFGLSPQWSIGNGFIGFIAGLVWLFKDRKRSLDIILIVSAVLAALAVVIFLFNRSQTNLQYFAAEEPVSLVAGLAIIVGLVLIVAIRFIFGQDIDIAAAVTWGMIGNILGIGFAAISDIWINGYSPATAIVGEFLPAAGPNLIFAAILVPLLVVAYRAVQRQSGR